MAKNKTGASTKAQYTAYKTKNQWRKNKAAKLTKRALENEADDSALKAFESGSKEYGRAKPGHKGWFAPQEAALLKKIAASDDPRELRSKLAKLYSVYADERPSAIRNAEKTVVLPKLLDEQLFEAGLINEKRYKAIKSRNRGLRRR